MMNEKLEKAIMWYIAISWGFAYFLLIWNYPPILLVQSFSPLVTSSYSLSIQRINSLNISPSEKTYFLNIENNLYQQYQQYINQIVLIPQSVLIPTNQFIEIELVLIVPPAILLGLIYYEAKKENNNG
jgi:hypothetical protein